MQRPAPGSNRFSASLRSPSSGPYGRCSCRHAGRPRRCHRTRLRRPPGGGRLRRFLPAEPTFWIRFGCVAIHRRGIRDHGRRTQPGSLRTLTGLLAMGSGRFGWSSHVYAGSPATIDHRRNVDPSTCLSRQPTAIGHQSKASAVSQSRPGPSRLCRDAPPALARSTGRIRIHARLPQATIAKAPKCSHDDLRLDSHVRPAKHTRLTILSSSVHQGGAVCHQRCGPGARRRPGTTDTRLRVYPLAAEAMGVGC